MVFVLLVVMVITLLGTTVAFSTVQQIRPAKASEDAAIATAAAEAGLQDFAAQANANCTTADSCSWINGNTHVSQQPVTAGNSATFSWRLVNADPGPTSYQNVGYLRVVSTGRSGPNSPQVRNLVADFKTSLACLICNQFYTQFETQGSDLINKRFPARSIVVDKSSSYQAIGQAAPLTAQWNAAPAAGMIGSPSVCDHYWYDDSVKGAGRYTYKAATSPGDWYQTATGSLTSTLIGQCEVAYGSAESFDGPVYSRDAFLLSYTVDGGTGPTFTNTVKTFWGGTTGSNTPTALPAWRSQAHIGGAPSTGSSKPQSTSTDVTLPTSLTRLPTTNVCTYTGPTRVLLNADGTATITSPLTPSSSSTCYQNQDASISGTGVVSAKISQDGYTIIVNDSSSSTGSAIFTKNNLNAAPPITKKANTHTTSGWGVSSDAATLASRVNTSLTADPTQSLSAAIASVISTYYPSTSVAGTGGAKSWVLDTHNAGTVASSGPTGSTPTRSASGPAGDPLLEQHSATEVYTENKAVTNFSDQAHKVEYACWTLALVLTSTNTASCPLLSSPSWQTVGDTQTPASVRTIYTYPLTSGSITADSYLSSFPMANDVMGYRSDQTGAVLPQQYSQTAGDLYVEGTVHGKLSLVANNDVIVTGSIQYHDSPTSPSTDAVDLVALKNVRIYHPVKCVEAPTSATTPGFCPNDITGLYPLTNVPTDFTNVHPSQQYADLRSNLNQLKVSGALFALTGSVYTDNYDRGAETLGSLTITGGSIQSHHGALGVKWEIAPSGSTRHKTGYDAIYRWDQTLGQGSRVLPYVPAATNATNGHTWTMISESTSQSQIAS